MDAKPNFTIEHLYTSEIDTDAAFEAALAKCKNAPEAFIVELQHQVNRLLDKYSKEVPTDLLIMSALPKGFAAMRISTLMRMDMPFLVLAIVAQNMLKEDMETTMGIINDMASGKVPETDEHRKREEASHGEPIIGG